MVLISPGSTNETNFFLLLLLIDNLNRERYTQIDTRNNLVPIVNFLSILFHNLRFLTNSVDLDYTHFQGGRAIFSAKIVEFAFA